MKRRTFLAGAGLGLVSATAGCLSSDPDSVNVDNLDVEQTDRKTITVTGSGVVETDPDEARFSVSVEAQDRDDAAVVVEELAAKGQELLTALEEYGIPEDNITTSRYRLRESSRRNRYEGVHQYSVTVDDPDAVGEVIDVAVDAGADSIGSVNFALSEDKQDDLYDEAVQKAVDDARNEAELFTTAEGVTLGDAVSIESTQHGHSPFRAEFDMAMTEADDSAPTEIEAGAVTVSAEATIEYEFDE